MAEYKNYHEAFTAFFEDPKRDTLRDLLSYNTGETDNLDFKESWPDITSVSKHILALANSGGGVIIFGIKEDSSGFLSSLGLESLKEKSEINNQTSKYIPSNVIWDILNFTYKDDIYGNLKGKKFQVIIVDYYVEITPVISIKDGKNIKGNTIYIRSGPETRIANHQQLNSLINKRIKHASPKELELTEHLDQLKTLYNKKRYENTPLVSMGLLYQKRLDNMGDYYNFIDKMIEKKEEIISKSLNIV